MVTVFSTPIDSRKLYRDLVEYSDNRKLKLKHKSETNFNQLIIQRNFYPTEIEYAESDKMPEVKFRTANSSYRTKFWQNEGFPNLQKVFQNFFKNDLKEVKNKTSD